MKNRFTTSRCLHLMVCCCLALAMGSAPKSAAMPLSVANELQDGITLLQQGKYSEARQKFLAATQRNPSSAESFFYLGRAEFNLHDLAAAEKALRRALDLDPRSGSVLYNLGVLLLEQKKSREALRYLEKASELGPQTIVRRVFEYHRQSLADTERLLDARVLTRVAKLIQRSRRVLLPGFGGSALAARRAADVLLNLGFTGVAVVDPSTKSWLPKLGSGS